jgi:DNA (cytosine-5)-methyltransferase 1
MWQLIIASDCGVPQLRPRTIMVALRPDDAAHFEWPAPAVAPPPTVGQTLFESIAAGGWEGAAEWASAADSIAPTLVGGSRKHGGADLGPTRAKRAWSRIGVDGHGLANEVPAPGFVGLPKITVQQAALLQGFPPSWEIQGRKTSAYRQVGNALPPPVARAVGQSLAAALHAADKAGLVVASRGSVASKNAAAA